MPAPPILIAEDQLLRLQYRCTTALSARLDQAIEFAGPEPLLDAVATAWRELASEQPTLRGVLDAAPSSPTLIEATGAEFRMLALAAGIAGLDDPTGEVTRLGRAYRELIRSGRARLAPELPHVR